MVRLALLLATLSSQVASQEAAYITSPSAGKRKTDHTFSYGPDSELPGSGSFSGSNSGSGSNSHDALGSGSGSDSFSGSYSGSGSNSHEASGSGSGSYDASGSYAGSGSQEGSDSNSVFAGDARKLQSLSSGSYSQNASGSNSASNSTSGSGSSSHDVSGTGSQGADSNSTYNRQISKLQSPGSGSSSSSHEASRSYVGRILGGFGCVAAIVLITGILSVKRASKIARSSHSADIEKGLVPVVSNK